MSELGDLLRQARERKGVTLEQVEAATRIRLKFLDALERGDYASLPGEVYVRGFVRSYASFLGLDPQEALSHHTPTSEGASAPAEAPAASLVLVSMEPGRSLRSVIVALAVVASILLVILAVQRQVWKLFPTPLAVKPALTSTSEPAPTDTQRPVPSATQAPTAEPTTEPAAEPSATTAPSPSPSATAGVAVRLVVTGRSWLQVTVDDQIVYSGVLMDVTREWSGRRQIGVRIGDASRVDVTVNGVHLGVLGRPEEVVSGTWGPDYRGEGTPTPSATPGA